MRVTSPDPKKKTVIEYEFTFKGGTTLPVTIDEEAGDTVSFESVPLAVVIHLSEKPSLINASIRLPAEEITIFQAHLLAIQKRARVVEDLTDEQKQEFENFLKGAPGGVH